MSEKKSSSFINIFVYLLIVILVILIALPLVFRVVFKEEESVINNPNNDSNASDASTATALNCSREVVVGTMNYSVSITSNYSNDTLNKVTFLYSLTTPYDATVTDNPVVNEINLIRNSGLVTEDSTDTEFKFVLTKEQKEANATNTSLDNYFQPLEEQQTNLESLGYTCSTLTA